jgi:hypothetical protein
VLIRKMIDYTIGTLLGGNGCNAMATFFVVTNMCEASDKFSSFRNVGNEGEWF